MKTALKKQGKDLLNISGSDDPSTSCFSVTRVKLCRKLSFEELL